jgi:hypothetical protein
VRSLTFSRLEAADMLALQAGRRNRVVFGMPVVATREEAAAIAAERVAWAARVVGSGGAKLIACFGIVEHFSGVHGLAWAMLADRIGVAHLPLTRFVASEIAACGLPRLELLARGPDLEPLLKAWPGLDTGQIVALALARPTPEMRWARMIGMTPAHVLRFYGGAAETFVLYERLEPAARAQLGEAA